MDLWDEIIAQVKLDLNNLQPKEINSLISVHSRGTMFSVEFDFCWGRSAA